MPVLRCSFPFILADLLVRRTPVPYWMSPMLENRGAESWPKADRKGHWKLIWHSAHRPIGTSLSHTNLHAINNKSATKQTNKPVGNTARALGGCVVLKEVEELPSPGTNMKRSTISFVASFFVVVLARMRLAEAAPGLREGSSPSFTEEPELLDDQDSENMRALKTSSKSSSSKSSSSRSSKSSIEL